MTEKSQDQQAYVKVLDRTGKEYICPVSSLKKPGDITEEDLKKCLDTQDAFSEPEVYAIIKNEIRKDQDE